MNGDMEPYFLMTHVCLRYPIWIYDSCGPLAASRLLVTYKVLLLDYPQLFQGFPISTSDSTLLYISQG